MPTYEFQCPTCGEAFERRLSISDEAPQKCECGAVAKRLISGINFILSGESWPSKAGRINEQMRKKNERLDRKQAVLKREAPVATLVPNVGGERTDTWAEAQKLAVSKGKDSASYDTHVAVEKTAKK